MSTEPFEDQCVKLWLVVFGNPAMTLDDARHAYQQQEPSIIAGWERLARRVTCVTTLATLEHVGRQHER